MYESPPQTLKYKTNSLNFEVKQVGLNGEVAKMETKITTIPKEMKGGSIMEMA